MEQVSISGRMVFYAGTLLLRDGESANLTIPLQEGAPIGGEILKIEIRFTEPEKAETTVSWVTEPSGLVKFTGLGWKHPFGAALPAPQFFGQSNSGKLWFDLAHFKTGTVNVAHIMLSRGGQ